MENDKILRLTKTTQTTIFCGTRESTFNALEYYLTTFGKNFFLYKRTCLRRQKLLFDKKWYSYVYKKGFSYIISEDVSLHIDMSVKTSNFVIPNYLKLTFLS